MATAEEAEWGEGAGLDGMAGVGEAAMGGEAAQSPLGFVVSTAAEAALIQDEIEDTDLRAAKEAAAISHFIRDPRDRLL